MWYNKKIYKNQKDKPTFLNNITSKVIKFLPF